MDREQTRRFNSRLNRESTEREYHLTDKRRNRQSFNSRLNRESTERRRLDGWDPHVSPASIHGSTERALKDRLFPILRLLSRACFNSRLNRESTERAGLHISRREQECFNSRLNRESTERLCDAAEDVADEAASIHGSTERALKVRQRARRIPDRRPRFNSRLNRESTERRTERRRQLPAPRFNSRLNRESTESTIFLDTETTGLYASIHGSTERALKESISSGDDPGDSGLQFTAQQREH